jgi:hypothetical protein
LKYFTCNGSYVGHGGVPMPKGIVRSISFIAEILSIQTLVDSRCYYPH